MPSWYPGNKPELESFINNSFKKKPKIKISKIHGFIVPHAGYDYSGNIAGKVFSLLKNKKIDKAVVIGPSHYAGFYGVKSIENIETPLGKVKITENKFPKLNYEHAIENQIPFLQKINSKIEILPLVVGEISIDEAEKIAKEISKQKSFCIFSTDLSHFLPYENAVKTDKDTIKIIESLDFRKIDEIDACGKFPLMVMMKLCLINKWKPKLIEYKNSGDVAGDKKSVVGYASFYF